MKDILLTILRDKETSRAAYREATEKLATLLAIEASQWVPQEGVDVETPMGRAKGVRFIHKVVLVPVLRSGLALLPPFLQFFPDARVGFVGMRRDEKTLVAHNYYNNLPPMVSEDRVIVLEPMIATGGSGAATLQLLFEKGILPENTLFISIIAAPEGIERIRKAHPKVKLLIAQTDQTLNPAKFIVPGLGDFGDRYFGT